MAYLLASLHEERVRVGSSSPVGPTTRGGSAQSHPAATAGSELTPSPSPRLKAITLPLIKWTLRSEIPGHRHDPFVAIADVRAPDGTPWEVNTADDLNGLTRAHGHCDIQRILAAAEMGLGTDVKAPPPLSGLYLTTNEHPVTGYGRRNFDFFTSVVLSRPESASHYSEVVLARVATSAAEAATHDPARVIARWTPSTGVVANPQAARPPTATALATITKNLSTAAPIAADLTNNSTPACLPLPEGAVVPNGACLGSGQSQESDAKAQPGSDSRLDDGGDAALHVATPCSGTVTARCT